MAPIVRRKGGSGRSPLGRLVEWAVVILVVGATGLVLIGLRREQFNLRMQQATGQLVRSDQYCKVRRDIARVKTVLNERSRGQTEAGQ